MEQRFSGHRVLVTGAGAGIGRAIARRFLLEGAYVTAADIDSRSLEASSKDLGDLRPRFEPVVADVARPDDQARLVGVAAGGEGVLDILVNNAAVFLMAGVSASPEQWRRTLEVNLVAPAQLVALSAEHLHRSGHGAVVNIASISAHVAQADRWTYNSSKAGILELTRCQALDLAPRGVRVNSVSPGYVWTDVLERAAHGDREKWEKVWGAFNPLGRCAEPREIAAAVAFLASAEASFITGADLLVDGGQVATGAEGLEVFEFTS